jgi:hypothetical protein
MHNHLEEIYLHSLICYFLHSLDISITVMTQNQNGAVNKNSGLQVANAKFALFTLD